VGPEPEQELPFNIQIDPHQMAGVWANFAQVSHSPYEFTLDFVRLDFTQQPPTGIVVSRVSLSPLLVSQLIEALQQNWQHYAERSLPREVYDDGSSTGEVDRD
jgi:hypothetical protein